MKKGQIEKGFKPYRSIVQEKQGTLKRLRSCSTCESYFSDRGSKEEECHNSNVTKFDVTVEDDGTTYCTFWRPIGMKK